jgi:hypothetical protein
VSVKPFALLLIVSIFASPRLQAVELFVTSPVVTGSAASRVIVLNLSVNLSVKIHIAMMILNVVLVMDRHSSS